MPTYEQRIAHFREAMAHILKKRVEFPLGAFVTVVDAKITTDLRFANIVLSVLPVSREEDVLDALHEYRNDILKEMAQTMGLRNMPRLHWSFDYTEEKASKVEQTIEEMKLAGEL